MAREIEAFVPILRATYRDITIYQFNRTKVNEMNLRSQLILATREMQKFKPYLQSKWQRYFGILENQQRFSPSDLICAFDFVIHQMHLRAGNKNLLREGRDVDALSPWSQERKPS
jgi:hypothetical protein